LNARTGELTPPGSTFTARSNSFLDFFGVFTVITLSAASAIVRQRARSR
jgi:hypothetical protein